MSRVEKAMIPGGVSLPRKLLIVPLSGRPIFPGVFTPINIRKQRIASMLDRIIEHDGLIGLVMTKEEDDETPSVDEIHRVGTAVKIVKRIKATDDSAHVFTAAIQRFRISKILSPRVPFIAAVEYLDDIVRPTEEREINALTRSIIGEMKSVMEGNPLFSEEIKMGMINIEHPGKLADMIASLLNIDRSIQQEVLETLAIKERMERVLVCIKQEQELLKIQRKIQKDINNKIEQNQREYFLREELKEIQKELGMKRSSQDSEYQRLKERFDSLKLPTEAHEKIEQELEKFQNIEKSSPEFQLTLSYLDTVLSLPWDNPTADVADIDMAKAEGILNKDHYKLTEVKERILELLAVAKLNNSFRGSIVCLIGPPGVGKTSVGKSIARALQKKFFRFSVGGMRDEAEIKGHRRTYIGAMPGKIIQGLKVCKSSDPVFMIDEIDKLGVSYQGDPSSALLEALDPEQNREFRDHYLDIPFDISQVLFITTANSLDTIPSALLDRMEVIRLSGYINKEKVEIAKRYIIPRSIARTGLAKRSVKYDAKTLDAIVTGWAREAGLRNFEKAIDKIHRKIARKVATDAIQLPVAIDTDALKEYLGVAPFNYQEFQPPTQPGMVLGLAWTPLGGAVLTIESIAHSGKGSLLLTGQAGDVMQESSKIAYAYAKSWLSQHAADNDFFDKHSVHMHLPAGATKKDGPSAGMAMALSLISLATGRKVKQRWAMTGELTLVGDVLQIGGLKEKVIAAKRNKITNILYPSSNHSDLAEIDAAVYRGISFHSVSHISDAISLLL